MRTDSRTVGLLLAAVVVAAAVTVALDAPAWLTTILSTLAVLGTTACLAQRRGRGWADAVAVGCAGVLVALLLLGFLLDVVPGGMSRVSWAVGAGVLALTALGWAHVRPASTPLAAPGRGLPFSLIAGYAGAAVLAGVALVVAVHATRIADRPGAALSIVHRGPGHHLRVEVSSGHAAGRYELVVTAASGRVTSSFGPFVVPADGRTTRDVRVESRSRSVISLRVPGSAHALRALVVSETSTST